MARRRGPVTSEQIFSDPHKAAAEIRRLRRAGMKVDITPAASRITGVRPSRRSDDAAEQQRQENERELVIAEQNARDYEGDEPDLLDWKDPTPTAFPHRPRSTRASYDPVQQDLTIWWARPGRLGDHTNYHEVTPQQWDHIKERAPSTGWYVNDVLNYHDYDYL